MSPSQCGPEGGPLKVLGQAEHVLKLARRAQAVDALHHARPLILAHPPLKEVGLAPAEERRGRLIQSGSWATHWAGREQPLPARWVLAQSSWRTARPAQGSGRTAQPANNRAPAHWHPHLQSTHCSEIISIQSKGLGLLYSLG